MSPVMFTADWLQQALTPSRTKYGWGNVEAVSSNQIGTGQMGSNVRLALTWSPDGDASTAPPATMVAKLPAEDEKSRATGAARGAYLREVSFYQQLAPRLQIRVPQCYFADYSHDDANFVLLLEDMHPATQGDQIAGADSDLASAVLVEAAGLHSPLWGNDEIHQYTFFGPPTAESAKETAAIYQHFLAEFLERHEGLLSSEVVEIAERFTPLVAAWAAPVPAEQLTVVHGDFRLDNMLFSPVAGERPTVVDWQTVTMGLGVRDVAYYLSAGLSRHDRGQHEADLVREYWERLVSAGVKGYDQSQCWTDYRRSAVAGLFMAVIASGLVVQTERGDEMFRVMANGAAYAAIELETLDLLAQHRP